MDDIVQLFTARTTFVAISVVGVGSASVIITLSCFQTLHQLIHRKLLYILHLISTSTLISNIYNS